MPVCSKCGRAFDNDLTRQAANDNVGIVYVKTDRELLRRENIQRIAKGIAALPVTSPEVINWIADTLFIHFEGIILWPDGKLFEIGDDDLDRIFDNPTATRWLRSVRQHANRPFSQIGSPALAERYRMLDVAFEIHERFLVSRP